MEYTIPVLKTIAIIDYELIFYHMKATLNLSDNTKVSQQEKFKKMSQQQLNENMIRYATKSWSAFIHYMLFSPEMTIHAQLQHENYLVFESLAYHENKEMLDFLLNCEQIKPHLEKDLTEEGQKILTHLFNGLTLHFQYRSEHPLFNFYFQHPMIVSHQTFIIDYLLNRFCHSHLLESINYLNELPLTSSYVKNSQTHHDLFLNAVKHYDLPMVDYFLSHFNIQLHYQQNEVIKFLFNRDKRHIHISLNQEQISQRLQALQEYFLYHYQLQLNPTREKILKQLGRQDIIDIMKKISLSYHLKHDLSSQPSISRAKI